MGQGELLAALKMRPPTIKVHPNVYPMPYFAMSISRLRILPMQQNRTRIFFILNNTLLLVLGPKQMQKYALLASIDSNTYA